LVLTVRTKTKLQGLICMESLEQERTNISSPNCNKIVILVLSCSSDSIQINPCNFVLVLTVRTKTKLQGLICMESLEQEKTNISSPNCNKIVSFGK